MIGVTEVDENAGSDWKKNLSFHRELVCILTLQETNKLWKKSSKQNHKSIMDCTGKNCAVKVF